jgi:hypothetical protein
VIAANSEHPRRLIVGVAGFKRAGKDTFAKALCDEWKLTHPHGKHASVAVAFADALRRTAAEAYGILLSEFTDDALKDAEHPAWGITRRQMLINVGVPATILPPAGYDHWVRRWEQTVDATPNPYQQLGCKQMDLLIVASDVRRGNEAAAIRSRGGSVVLVRRRSVGWNGHVTEEYARDESRFDYVVDNDSDLDHLRREARRILAEI